MGPYAPSGKSALSESKVDIAGNTHLSFAQHINGVPVFDGMLRFHFDRDGKLRHINGVIFPATLIETTPRITPTTAASIALVTVAKRIFGNISNRRKPEIIDL
ncbi:MAG: hypothetical protein R2795_13910 [Saprospiraceae bacterium]